jgi:hypothetical protein
MLLLRATVDAHPTARQLRLPIAHLAVSRADVTAVQDRAIA